MLAGVPFDVIVFDPERGELIYPLRTDSEGRAGLRFDSARQIAVRELLRHVGGLWRITTPHLELGEAWYITVDGAPRWELACGRPGGELWIGNAPVAPPRTGRVGPAPRYPMLAASPARAILFD